MALVSLCIPTFNGARFIEESLQSALAQSFRDMEILVVDDGSSDDTLRRVQSLATLDPRIRVVRNEKNLGLVGNWNRCLEIAHGEWIKFLFQDDLLHPQCVEKLLAEARRQSAPFLACDRNFLFAESTTEELRAIYARNRATINAFLGPGRGVSADEFAQRIPRRLNNNYVGEPTSTLIHRSVFERIGRFNPEFTQLCDLEYWTRAASHYGIAFVPEALTTFRVHSSATSAINRNAHSFRSTGLEGLILVDAFLEQDAHARLRERWAALGVLGAIQNERWDRANEIFEFVRKNRASPAQRESISSEYAAFLSRHPSCRISRIEHLRWLSITLPLRYKFRLGQALNPILPKPLKRGSFRPL
ncbi:glycosyltransferase family 2 protein [Niveibacterium terrae]|uniref:glycosyltransferase family 2 protein n=1 Tax=Niveibacterium terrae TaxID=3373598 RepID=UPI003A9436D5